MSQILRKIKFNFLIETPNEYMGCHIEIETDLSFVISYKQTRLTKIKLMNGQQRYENYLNKKISLIFLDE